MPTYDITDRVETIYRLNNNNSPKQRRLYIINRIKKFECEIDSTFYAIPGVWFDAKTLNIVELDILRKIGFKFLTNNMRDTGFHINCNKKLLSFIYQEFEDINLEPDFQL